MSNKMQYRKRAIAIQFRAFIKVESAQYGRIVEFAKITPDN